MLFLKLKGETDSNMANDKFMPDFPSAFTIEGAHNHNLQPIGPRRNLPISNETIRQFRELFNSNLTPTQACQRQMVEILEKDVNPKIIQDTRYLPELRQVYHLWVKWRNGEMTQMGKIGATP